MTRGKYLSLEEARKQKKLDPFCKEHPSQSDERRFDAILKDNGKGVEPGRT